MYQEKEEYFVSSVKTCDSNHLLEAPQEFKMQTHNTLNNIHSSSLKLEALLLVFLSLTEYQVFTKLEELSTEKQRDTQQNVYFRDEKWAQTSSSDLECVVLLLILLRSFISGTAHTGHEPSGLEPTKKKRSRFPSNLARRTIFAWSMPAQQTTSPRIQQDASDR